jgi:hypothetical protein
MFRYIHTSHSNRSEAATVDANAATELLRKLTSGFKDTTKCRRHANPQRIMRNYLENRNENYNGNC